METYQILIIAGLAFGILEIVTSTFLALGFSFAFFSVSLVQYLTGSTAINRDILIFCISLIIATIILRVFFKKNRDQKKLNSDDVNSY